MPCINDVSRKNFALVDDTSLSFRNVARELDKAIAKRGILKTFSDTGTKFTNLAIINWLQDKSIDCSRYPVQM